MRVMIVLQVVKHRQTLKSSRLSKFLPLIVKVVQAAMRILRIVNDHRSTESIAILELVMRAVPEGVGLSSCSVKRVHVRESI